MLRNRVSHWRNIFYNAAENGLILLLTVISALVIDNSSLHRFYEDFINQKFSITIFTDTIELSFANWINEFVMTIFFLFISIEIKHELIEGDLSTMSQRILATLASFSGVILPGLIYSLINYSDNDMMHGWAIPTGTDVAFMLGAMAAFKRHIPKALKAFAVASVVIDDLIAILIIALFYTQTLRYIYLFYAIICILILIIFNYFNISAKVLYVVVGLFLWYCFYSSGIHATISGAILAMTIPMKTKDGRNILSSWLQSLSPIVLYVITPIFAFVNSGIYFAHVTKDVLLSPVAIGVFLGLFLGKQVGIFGSSILMMKMKLVKMPMGTSFIQLYAISIFCGIGFTVTLFVASLAFGGIDEANLLSAKVGMLCGSITSFLFGSAIFLLTKKN